MADKATVEHISVGDHVRLKSFMVNQHGSYQVDSSQFASRREPVNGLVLSIRDVKTGQLVASTKGKLEGFVFELLFDNTFSPRFASLRNAPRSADRATATPNWRRMRALLRELAEKGQYVSTSMPDFNTESSVAKLLDGWKIVKIHSDEIVNLEKSEPEPEAEPAE